MPIAKITDETFDADIAQASTPVLVDFWATWCGPCKQIAPSLDQISAELAGVLTVVKLNIEDSPATPARYGVRGVPTLMLFRDGQVIATRTGAATKPKIVDWLKTAGVQA